MERIFKEKADIFAVWEGETKIAIAHLNRRRMFVDMLWVHPAYRRQGIALSLMDFIASKVGKLTRGPSRFKNDATLLLSAKLGDALNPEIV